MRWCASAWNWPEPAIICRPADLDYHEIFPVAQKATERACWAMPEELRTAVSNLLDNAVKYSPDGVHISVELRCSR